YGSSAERTAALSGWLDHYNFRRRHGSLGHKAPAARLAELEQRVG
ncbi:MAG TPA: integrase core domain-containing protein, partial [Solirubrobacterales bacterium]|nr:integrase core domain-containing protein [Solirubrobacterales bacterium]